ncbi:hypothetical protein DIPPA_18957 [Diplonema papillatum]|nr:hypothetical protein DIPPA_18957 [Diplonema papillatum]
MSVEDDKVSKAAKQLLERFSSHLVVAGNVQKQVAQMQAKNAQLEKEKLTALQEKEKEKDLCDGLDKLARDLRKKKDDTLEDVKRREDVQNAARLALTQRFQDTISNITKQLEVDTEQQTAATNENRRLRERLSQLGREVELRAQQYEQLIKTRDVELRLSEAKAEHLKELAKGDRFKSDLQQKRLVEERKAELELKEQLTVITTKFDSLQDTIVKSNKLFKEYKSEMDKLTKRIRSMETEKAEALTKAAKKRPTVEKLAEEVHEQQKKLDSLKKAEQAVEYVMGVLKKVCALFRLTAS